MDQVKRTMTLAAGRAESPLDVVPVLILGHPHVDVWQAVLPARFGLDAWPAIGREHDIKAGTLAALGWPHTSEADIAGGWRRILAAVRDWRDLDPALLGRVEELIDFVTG
jgi:hypothetical protein